MSDIQFLPDSQASSSLVRRRFTAGTILIPIAFIGVHYVVANLASLLFMLGYLLLKGMQGADVMVILQDPELLTSNILDYYPVIAAIYSAGLIPIFAIFLMLRRRRDSRAILLEKPKASAILSSLAIMIGCAGAINYWMILLTELGSHVPWIQSSLDDYAELASSLSPAAGYIWLFLGVTVLVPVTEELLFRGIVQGELRKAMPEWVAIIIQALIFAAYHMQPIQISYVILPGLMLGFAYYWTRSIWVPIAMHIGFNFFGSFLPTIIGEDALFGNILGWTETGFIVVGALSAVYLYKTRRRPEPAMPPPAAVAEAGRSAS
jgi:uncharacterized protein